MTGQPMSGSLAPPNHVALSTVEALAMMTAPSLADPGHPTRAADVPELIKKQIG